MDNAYFELMVTLWPSMPHFPDFATDYRLSGIRLNSAQMSNAELDSELETIRKLNVSMPLFYDIKSRQLRIEKVNFNPLYLDITLNHAISVNTPTPVLFKGGEDGALLVRLEEGGKRLIFDGGPMYMVEKGHSVTIRDKSLVVHDPIFIPEEIEKIEKVRSAGFKNYYLSFVEKQSDIDQFEELVGKDSLIYLKIESMKGLAFVANEFKKKENHILVAARGDLYVEIDRPHEIMAAMKLIIEKDPEAQVGSRMLLSLFKKVVNSPQNTVEERRFPRLSLRRVPAVAPILPREPERKYEINPVPSVDNFLELAWMYDIGYRKALLCDEICLYGDLLGLAVNIFDNFRAVYP
jgi:hypothetical protein